MNFARDRPRAGVDTETPETEFQADGWPLRAVNGGFEGDWQCGPHCSSGVSLRVLVLVSLLNRVTAQDPPVTPESPATDDSGTGLKSGYRLQEADDVALPLKPKVPRPAAADIRNEALAWYMTGRLLDSTHRQEPRKSLSAFRKAIKLDPEAIEIYRHLVPLEFAFENIEAAIRYASKAVELDPEDHEILQLLARQAAETGQLPEAIKHLEQAVKSSRIDKLSPQYVLLNTSLGVLYAKTGQRELAADSYEVIFDAVKTPEKYGLDLRARKMLLADPPTSYEQIGQVLLDGKRLQLCARSVRTGRQAVAPGCGKSELQSCSDPFPVR